MGGGDADDCGNLPAKEPGTPILGSPCPTTKASCDAKLLNRGCFTNRQIDLEPSPTTMKGAKKR